MKTGEREKKLIDACRNGDRTAMEKLYVMYYKPMFNTAYRIVNDFHFAEDIMQESFLKAFEKLDRFEGRSTFGAWLKRIVINESLQWLKKYKRFQFNAEEIWKEELVEEDPDEDLLGDNHVPPEKLLELLNRLKPNYKIILQLYFIEGYDYEEIGQIMGITYQNARTMLSRAKQKLKKLLENERISDA